MSGAPSSFIATISFVFLVIRPGATSSVLAPSSDALVFLSKPLKIGRQW